MTAPAWRLGGLPAPLSPQVCIYTSAEPASAGTCSQVCLELVGSRGTSGPICLDRQASTACFSTGAADVFQLEAPAVGELRQLNIWLEGAPAAAEGGEGGAGAHELPNWGCLQ
jgi:hypothetical protein